MNDWQLWGTKLTDRKRFAKYVILPVILLWIVLLIVLLHRMGVTF